ncbi:hypothetical protein RA167_13075 (plasmid) [Mycetohabitans endofungorum]|uniref:hypothetical protein n=1 Tax=Mycetohabitans endofungorum TaxID=417203 RepID=UPI0030CA5BEF
MNISIINAQRAAGAVSAAELLYIQHVPKLPDEKIVWRWLKIWHLASGIWHLASGIWHLASGIWHLASGIWHLASGICIWHLASGIWHLASITNKKLPNFS